MINLKNPALLRGACLVAGEWIVPKGRETIEVDNPACCSIIGKVHSLKAGDIEKAVDATERAFVDWSRRAAGDRAASLRRWFDLIVAHTDDLGALVTAEQGKPLAETKGEVVHAASFVESPMPFTPRKPPSFPSCGIRDGHRTSIPALYAGNLPRIRRYRQAHSPQVPRLFGHCSTRGVRGTRTGNGLVG
jgi:hypothetical protein